MKVPKSMVGVNGDNSWLRLIITCALPGHFNIACCSRKGFCSKTFSDSDCMMVLSHCLIVGT